MVYRPREDEAFATAELCEILEIWNRCDDAAVSIARATVAPGVTTRRHRLHDIVERYLIIRGQGRVEIGELAPRTVSAGDLVFIPRACPQRIANTGNADLVFLAICTPRFSAALYEDIDTTDQDS